MKDKQGILRGRCTVCNCTEYITPKDKLRCRTCNHVPAKHEDVGQLRGQIHGKDITDAVGSYSGVNNISGGKFQADF